MVQGEEFHPAGLRSVLEAQTLSCAIERSERHVKALRQDQVGGIVDGEVVTDAEEASVTKHALGFQGHGNDGEQDETPDELTYGVFGHPQSSLRGTQSVSNLVDPQ